MRCSHSGADNKIRTRTRIQLTGKTRLLLRWTSGDWLLVRAEVEPSVAAIREALDDPSGHSRPRRQSGGLSAELDRTGAAAWPCLDCGRGRRPVASISALGTRHSALGTERSARVRGLRPSSDNRRFLVM